jgi:hypothetical protein
LRVALLVVAFLVAVRLLLPWMIFKPTAEISRTPEHYGMPFEDVTVTSSDGVPLSGWYIPASDARGTLLFFHGNAGNI